MPTRDILITPRPTGSTFNPSIDFSNWSGDTIKLEVLVDGTVSFIGDNGQLFTIGDSLTGSLMSVNNISGMPILEVFSDDRVVGGAYNSNAFVVSGSTVGLGTAYPGDYNLYVSGNTNLDGGFYISQGQEINEIVLEIKDYSTDYQLPTAEAVYELVIEYVVASGGTGGASDFLSLTDTISSYNTGRILVEGGASVGDFSGFTYGSSVLKVEGRVEEGFLTTAVGLYAHAEGYKTTAVNNYSHAEGHSTTASGDYSHAEGFGTKATTSQAHAEGQSTSAGGQASHAEGYNNIAAGIYSHAEGTSSEAGGNSSHSEGNNTTASGDGAHAEGHSTIASGEASHAEGNSTTAEGNYSHSEGSTTKALGDSSHAEGVGTVALYYMGHSEGYNTYASGTTTHSSGYETGAHGVCQYVVGAYNLSNGNDTIVSPADADKEDYIFIVGNGVSEATRNNALSVTWRGNVAIDSGMTLGTNSNYVDEITTVVNASSTDAQLPTAAAVYGAIPVVDIPSYFVTNEAELRSALEDINDNYNGGTITINGTIQLSQNLEYDFSGIAIYGNGRGRISIQKGSSESYKNKWWEIHITGSTTFDGVVFKGTQLGLKDYDFREDSYTVGTYGGYGTRDRFIKIQDPTAALTFKNCTFSDIIAGPSGSTLWKPIIQVPNVIEDWNNVTVTFENCSWSSHRGDNDYYIEYEGLGLEALEVEANASFNLVVHNNLPSNNAISGTSCAYWARREASSGDVRFTSDESAWSVYSNPSNFIRKNNISDLVEQKNIAIGDHLMIGDISSGNVIKVAWGYLTGGTGGGGGGVTEFIDLTDTPVSYSQYRVLFESGSAVIDSSGLTFEEGEFKVSDGYMRVSSGLGVNPYYQLSPTTNGAEWKVGADNTAVSTGGYFYIHSKNTGNVLEINRYSGCIDIQSGISFDTSGTEFVNEIVDTIAPGVTDHQLPTALAVYNYGGGGGGGVSDSPLICVETEAELYAAVNKLNSLSGGTIQITPTLANPVVQLTKNHTFDLSKIIIKGGGIRFGSYSGGYTGFKIKVHSPSGPNATGPVTFQDCSLQGTASDSGYQLDDPSVHILEFSAVTRARFTNCSFPQIVGAQSDLNNPIPNISFSDAPDWASVQFDGCQTSTVNATGKYYPGLAMVLTGQSCNHFYITTGNQKMDSHTKVDGSIEAEGPYTYLIAGLKPGLEARYVTDGTAQLVDTTDDGRGSFGTLANPMVNEINRWSEVLEEDLADSKITLTSDIGKLYSISVTNFLASGGTSGSVTAPDALAGLETTEVDDYVVIEITGSTTSDTDTLEIWASQEAFDSGFNLIGKIDKASLADYMVIYDDSYTRKSQIWYRGYAIKTGKYSTVTNSNLTPSNDVSGVTNMHVVSEDDKIFIEYDLPNDRRLEEIEIWHDASLTLGGLSYGSSKKCYSGGIRDNYVYEIVSTELNHYHQFWVNTITRT